jgi:hypothetical protein
MLLTDHLNYSKILVVQDNKEVITLQCDFEAGMTTRK